jgi:hypothetical protein
MSTANANRRKPMTDTAEVTMSMLGERLSIIVDKIEGTATIVNTIASMIDVLTSCIDNDKRRDLCVTMVEQARDVKDLREELRDLNSLTLEAALIAMREDRVAA